MKSRLYLFLAVVFVACLLFIPDCKIVHASASVEDYGAHMEEYEITTTEQALKRYQQKEVYRIDSCSVPLKKSGFSKYSTYNKYTKNYYTIRSYMAEFEKKGGGTLILEAGTYELCTAIYIPNNVTLILEDGVNILKTTKTGTKKVKSSESLFQLVTAQKAKKKASVKKYKGVKNVNIIGIGLTQDNKTALGDNWVTELYEGEYYTRVTYKYKKYSNAEIIPITVDFPEVSEGDGEDIVMEEEKNNI